MHIPDGIINTPALLVGSYGLTSGATWFCLKQIHQQERDPQAKIPKAALLTAAFFVINLINIPIPPASLHLVLNGMMGMMLGYYALPAILVALFFQAMLFQHGGITTLGLNALIMGGPALLSFAIFRTRDRWGLSNQLSTKVFAFVAGSLGVFLAAVLFTGLVLLSLSGDINFAAERQTALVALSFYAVPAVIEGIFTMQLATFLERVKPELLEGVG